MTTNHHPDAKVCSLVFLLHDDQILLAMKKRGFGSGRYNGIGGKQDAGETIEQTLVRETQEEIGVTLLSWEKVAIHDFIMDSQGALGAAPWHMLVHVYVSYSWQGEPIETEEMAPHWFARTDIPYDQMWEDDIIWLPTVLAGRSLRTVFNFDSDDHMKSARLTFVADSADLVFINS